MMIDSPEIFEGNSTITHYKLNDGRIWSVDEAKFVASVDEFANVQKDAIPLEELVSALDFYGYPKGALKSDADYAAEARAKRDALLAETDFMMMPDYPLSESKRAAVAAYRQFLRDVPAQSGFPRQIDWPLKTF